MATTSTATEADTPERIRERENQRVKAREESVVLVKTLMCELADPTDIRKAVGAQNFSLPVSLCDEELEALLKFHLNGYGGTPEPAEAARKRPILRTAREICALQIPPVAWIVSGLLPTGLSVLAGKPKVGKSFLALHLSLAVASGGYALGSRDYSAPQGPVIALLLEDTDRRLQERLTKLQQGQPQPDALHISIRWPRGGEGIEALDEWCKEIKPRLVIVDTLQQVRALSRGRNANAYESDYLAISGLKQMADRYNMALLVLHHQRKMGCEDIYDSVSGTLGITGAADSIYILQRAKSGVSSILSGRGRDLDDFSLAVQFDKPSGLWRLLGDAHEVALSSQRQEVLKALRESGPLGPTALAVVLGKNVNVVKQTLFQMAKAGDVFRAGNGIYTL